MHADLRTIFIAEANEALDAAQTSVELLVSLSEAAKSLELRRVLNRYLEQARDHVNRIEALLESLEDSRSNRTCHSLKGLSLTAEETLTTYQQGPALDTALINIAQKLAHYQIASYGTLCAWAKTLSLDTALERLKPCLSEAKGADERLKLIAEEFANTDAT